MQTYTLIIWFHPVIALSEKLNESYSQNAMRGHWISTQVLEQVAVESALIDLIVIAP